MMDEARAAGLKLAVCSAGTKSSIIFSLKNLLGEARFQALDLFLAGEDEAVGLSQRHSLHMTLSTPASVECVSNIIRSALITLAHDVGDSTYTSSPEAACFELESEPDAGVRGQEEWNCGARRQIQRQRGRPSEHT